MDKAMRFLSDPAVMAAATTDDQKRLFLLSKGVDGADIDAAMAALGAGAAGAIAPAPPVPPFYQNGTVQRRATQWLFVLLLAGGTVFHHYRRILTEYCRQAVKRVNDLLAGDHDKEKRKDEMDMRLKGIEEKLGALESAYRYLQADVAQCKADCKKSGKKQ